MHLKTVLGLLALLLPLSLSSAAHADWRENLLGNRIYDNTSLTGGPAAKPSKKAKGVKTASLGSKGYSPSLFTWDDEPKQPKSKSKSKSKAASSGGSDYFSGGQTISGQASYYWQPQKLASGGTFNPSAMTAAHKTLPFGTKVRVTNQHNGKSVVVTINDRGPYVAGRVIDLSAGAAGVIGMKQAGVVPVKIAVIGK